MAIDVFSRNGAILPIEQATIPLSNIEYAYGFGVYENVRVVRGNAFFLDEHVKRLLKSADAIELRHAHDAAAIASWTMDLVKHIEADALNLKILLIGAKDPKDTQFIILALAPLFPEKKLYTKGATAITYTYERQFPQAKTLNMLGSYIAYSKAKAAGCYDALLLNRGGYITEGTRTNFFVIKDKTIIGAPKEHILEGVTMVHVLDVARKNGYTIEEKLITQSELQNYDGAFLTSTSSKIMPVTKIDEFTYTEIPPALRELMVYFDALFS